MELLQYIGIAGVPSLVNSYLRREHITLRIRWSFSFTHHITSAHHGHIIPSRIYPDLFLVVGPKDDSPPLSQSAPSAFSGTYYYAIPHPAPPRLLLWARCKSLCVCLDRHTKRGWHDNNNCCVLAVTRVIYALLGRYTTNRMPTLG